jgi:hypothetical protein
LNLVEHVIKPIELVYEPHVSFDIHVKLVHVQPVKIVIPPDTFQQHLPKTFFQLEVGEMEIDEMHAQIKIQTFALRDGLSLKKSN